MIPPELARLFWDTNFSSLGLEQNDRTVISRVLNYGTLGDWRWLAKTYGRERVQAILTAKGRASLREPARRLAEVLFI